MSKAIELDADTESADWTKVTWDLPPYKSKQFYDEMGPDFDIEHFKTTPVYQHAVDTFLIHDDEWVGDSVEASKPEVKKPKAIHIHIH